FFFSSRRRHTRFSRDWSSDVCSSDLRFLSTVFYITAPCHFFAAQVIHHFARISFVLRVSEFKTAKGCTYNKYHSFHHLINARFRSEERRVGKECRSGLWPYHPKRTKG